MSNIDRFRKSSPCPICGGHKDLPPGHGQRCWGFLSEDRAYAHCMREEYAGSIPQNVKDQSYPHHLIGDCRCGIRHDPTLPITSTSHIVATYDYVDAHGTLRYQTVRLSPKNFYQRRPDGKGGWINNLKGVTPVIFNLPAVLEGIAGEKTILLVEGEADALALQAHGYIATCNHGGATKWGDDQSQWLIDAVDVVCFGDNDAAGRAHLLKQIMSLTKVGILPRLARMHALPEHGDIRDWLKTHTQEDLDRLITDATPPADTTFADERAFPAIGDISYTTHELQKKILPDLVEVVPRILPEGLALMAGGAGLGKSFLCLQIALAVSSGATLLGKWPTNRGDVLCLATEDSERRIRDRMRHMWKDKAPWPNNLTIAHHPQTLDTGLIDQLKEWLETHAQVRLIVIDLFADVKPSRKPNGDWYADDRAAAKLLSDLANTRHLCVLCSHHTNRLKSDDPFESFHGGSGLLGAADTKMILQHKPEGQAEWLMKGRDIPQQTYRLQLREGTWEYIGEGSFDGLSAARQEIVTYFRQNPGLHSPVSVAKALGKPRTTTSTLMIKMCQHNVLIKTDYGVGLYRLTEDEDALKAL
jgi:hypothetical protein